MLEGKGIYALGGSPGLLAALELTGVAYYQVPETRRRKKMFNVKESLSDWAPDEVNKYAGGLLDALLTYPPQPTVGCALGGICVSP